MTIDRRALLKALSGAAAGALASRAGTALAQAAAMPTATQFGKLSAALTGYPEADAATVGKMLRAFATPQRRAALAALGDVVAATPAADLDAALAARKLDGIAGDLVAAWYSGIVADGTQPSLVLYTDAYVWTAMTFSKPMGVCGGPTGYWADPPP
ncbi:MAG: sugar dehydrogenase complex small subunit [Burkholderiales bacterium]